MTCQTSRTQFESLRIDGDTIVATRGNTTASVSLSDLTIAHAGCMLPGSPTVRKTLNRDTQDELTREFGKAWKNTKYPKERLAEVLMMAAETSGLPGLELIDSMKYGTDFWRGGKFLTESLEMSGFITTTLLSRIETLCPTESLLDRFREDPEFSFDAYSRAYVQHLYKQNRLLSAAVHVILSIAQGRLPVLYCTDPFIPKYNRLAEHADLRVLGCHRIPLVHSIADVFLEAGASSVRILEADQLGREVWLKIRKPRQDAS